MALKPQTHYLVNQFPPYTHRHPEMHPPHTPPNNDTATPHNINPHPWHTSKTREWLEESHHPFMDHMTTCTDTHGPYMSPHTVSHTENQSTHSSQRSTPTPTNELHSLESTTAHYDHPFLSELYEPPFAAPIIVANATYHPHSLPLSHTIPHIRFPIGTGDPNSDATLCAMIDSGAGCNLGRKSYHLSIYEKFPKLIQAVESQVNQAEWQDVNIGHIHDTGQPVVISAVIVYKTPYIIDGHPVTI